jgi:hypothetical protein
MQDLIRLLKIQIKQTPSQNLNNSQQKIDSNQLIFVQLVNQKLAQWKSTF